MKILSVSPSYYPAFQFGGAVFSTHLLNKHLVKQGVDVTVYTTKAGLPNSLYSNDETSLDGVKVRYFEHVADMDFLGQTGWHFSPQLTRALNAEVPNFDLVHIQSVWNYPVAAAAHFARKYKKPYVVTPRGVLYPVTFSHKLWKKRLYWHLVSKRDLSNAAFVHYTTTDEAERCHAFMGLHNRYEVVPNGIEIHTENRVGSKDRFYTKYPQLKGKRLVLFMGRLNWKKGLDILLKAFVRLVTESPDVHLLVAGTDDGDGYANQMRKLVSALTITDHVTFTDMLSGVEKSDAFMNSYMFVLPSRSENFGLAVAEGMSYGLPIVISSEVGLAKDLREDSAALISDLTPEDLYQNITGILSDPTLASTLARNGIGAVRRRFNIDSVAKAMLKNYSSLL